MSVISIMPPKGIVDAFGKGFSNPTRVMTPNPKEATVVTTTDSTNYLNVDLGSMQSIDTVFVGYTNDTSSGGLIIAGIADDAKTQVFSQYVPAAQSDMSGIVPQHFLLVLPAPQTVRFISISSPGTLPINYAIGVVRAGLSFRPTWGPQWGAGRPFEDTSSVDRLMGGGFGIDDGVVVPGYSWTFGDLQDEERRQLYTMARLLGQSKSVLVVEDPDPTPALNERIHWGLFKLDTYERTDPKNTKWAFIVRDWL
jgi:hypothetical protein